MTEKFDAQVECQYCGHVWHYNGWTPYAQCGKCQRSNNLSDRFQEDRADGDLEDDTHGVEAE